MLIRTLSVRRTPVFALGAALLLSTTLLSTGHVRRVGLDEQTLTASRGSNQGNSATQSSCTVYNGNAICGSVGMGLYSSCMSCSTAYYNDVTGGGINYMKGGAQYCGENTTGECVYDDLMFLICDDSQGDATGQCSQPQAIMMQAH